MRKLVWLGLVVAGACSSPTAPAAVDPAGSWTGETSIGVAVELVIGPVGVSGTFGGCVRLGFRQNADRVVLPVGGTVSATGDVTAAVLDGWAPAWSFDGSADADSLFGSGGRGDGTDERLVLLRPSSHPDC